MPRAIVPARVSNRRGRTPLRRLVRSGVRSAYPAPHRASTSAPMRAWMKVWTISRSRSVSASSRCLRSQTRGSIVGSTTVFLLSEFLVRTSMRMKRWSAISSTYGAGPGAAPRTPRGRTLSRSSVLSGAPSLFIGGTDLERDCSDLLGRVERDIPYTHTQAEWPKAPAKRPSGPSEGPLLRRDTRGGGPLLRREWFGVGAKDPGRLPGQVGREHVDWEADLPGRSFAEKTAYRYASYVVNHLSVLGRCPMRHQRRYSGLDSARSTSMAPCDPFPPPAWTVMRRGLAVSATGTRTVRTPPSRLAWRRSVSRYSPSRTWRSRVPCCRS